MTLTQIRKMRRQSGFTLVELLIVMLIVGILSIAMLPMYKKYMTKAKYTAEGLPILATIKTQLDLFIYDKSYAPGLSGTVYCWQRDDDSLQFTPSAYTLGESYPDSYDVTLEQSSWHLRSLIREKELQGKLIQPNHVFYACINSGAPKAIDEDASETLADNYGYAIGVFGDGQNLPQNSGVATMELHLSEPQVGTTLTDEAATGVTVLGTWENYDASGINPDVSTHQIRFMEYASAGGNSSGCGIFTKENMQDANISDIATLQGMLDQMMQLECGTWEFPRYAATEE